MKPPAGPTPPASAAAESLGDRRERARTGLRQVALGSVLLVVGLVVTVGTLAAARPGGRYTLAYGPIVFGLIELVRGLLGWWPNRASALPSSPVRTTARASVRSPPDRIARPSEAPVLPGVLAPPPVRQTPLAAPRVTPAAPSTPPAPTANEAERRRLGLSATEAKLAERPAAPWHRPAMGVRRETDPITLLRFAAYRCEIGAEGLRASFRDGTTRALAWSEIATLAIRQLPPDAPWDRSLVVDLAPASGPPVRILSTTFVNFAALPGGATATRLDNIRGLVRLVRDRNPDTAIEPGTEPVLQGGAPLRLLSMNQFADYDARYG